MKLPNIEHTSRPWRIHEITGDFRVEDVWALPTPGGPEDFPRLVDGFAADDPAQGLPAPARALWVIREKLGELGDGHGPRLVHRRTDDLDDGIARDIRRRTVHVGPEPEEPVGLALPRWKRHNHTVAYG